MASNTNRLKNNRPPLFEPNIIDYMQEGSSDDTVFLKSNGSEFEDTSMGLTASFKYNPIGKGLVSTQQLNLDWSRFENHTFFNSAQVKTNVAFDKIINQFPFDGTRKEVELFFDELTGFEKWVYDQLPKQRGYLFFSGSKSSTDGGTYITVKDYAGASYPSISTKRDGKPTIEPENSSMTIEAHVYVPSQSLGNLNQYIAYKTNSSGSKGFAVTLETSTGSSTADLSMIVVSGSNSELKDKATLSVEYDKWNHVAWVWDRTPGVDQIKAYLNAELKASSSTPYTAGPLGTDGQNMYIGSGSALGTFIPNTTFSGALDEFRLWHDTRTLTEIKQYQKKLVWPDSTLKLYYKFNEPSGSNTDLVLDYSTNSLHGKLNTRGVVLGVRDITTGSLFGSSPMTLENLEFCPILFPQFEESISLRSTLLTSASNFDLQNPNLITRLIPEHYLQEGMSFEGLEDVDGYITDLNENGNNPRENILGGTQAMLSLLYTWAKFFDEMKLYIQAFSTLKNLDYDSEDTIPSDFLSVFAQMEGIELPPLFVGSSIEQYIQGENLDNEISNSIIGLKQIQNEIWKRILISMKNVIRSKGTIHSIKSFIRSAGINPDNTFRIREYGGPTKNSLEFTRENRFEVATSLNFISGGVATSEPLSSSAEKLESGWPYDGANSQFDNIFTSGSFTVEGTYRFLSTIDYQASQSLARLKLSGSLINSDGTTISNVVAVTGSKNANPAVTFFANPNSGSTDYLALTITGADVFDGDLWYVSFGRFRNDDPRIDSNVSSSYFLRIAKNKNGEIIESYVSSSWFIDTGSYFSVSDANTDGPYLQIGSSSLNAPFGTGSNYLEQSTISPTAKVVEFEGRATQIRFWSKALTDLEWKEHVRNFKSVGVQDPKTNFNFVDQFVTGAWERLRMDVSTDQITLTTDASGDINLTDFTQNYLGMSGSSFPVSSTVIVPEHFYYSQLTSRIDEGATNKKVRSRSYKDIDKLIDAPWADVAPVYEVNPFLEVSDSTKLTIDYSIVDALDQDIITIFSSLDEYNNMIGNPELLFADHYKDLETMREIYFNKLEGKINIKGFFEFYKWFDTNIGTFVEQLVPRKSKFLGTNYIIESHFLERAKVQYKFEDIYLGEDIRSGLKDRILLQLITGRVDRF